MKKFFVAVALVMGLGIPNPITNATATKNFFIILYF